MNGDDIDDQTSTSVRTPVSSISSTPTASCPRFKQRSTCWACSRKEVADRLHQRDKSQRRRQSGAAARHAQCRTPRQRGILSGRCPRTVAMAPMGDASRARPAASACTPARRRWRRCAASSARRMRSIRSQPTPAARRSSTTTTCRMGIVRAQQATSSYYILGYYPTNTAKDGKLRRVKITLKNRECGAVVSRGLLRRQGVQQVHRVRQGTPA